MNAAVLPLGHASQEGFLSGWYNAFLIDLGDLKGNIGPQNYELPADVDLERYRTVVVWCVRFSVAFTAADLAPAA